MKAAVRARNTVDSNLASVVALYPTRSQGICLQCRLQAAALQSRPPTTYLTPFNRRYASESLRTRIASKIWGSTAKDVPRASPEASGEESEAVREASAEEVKASREASAEEAEALPEASREDLEAVREAEQLEMDIENTGPPEEELWTSLPVDQPADYKPALNAYGLPHTSDFQELLKDPEIKYRRFMREAKLPSSELAGAVRQALVDISTREETGLPLTDPTNVEDGRGLGAIEHAKIFQSKDGKILVQWAVSDMAGEPTQRTSTSFPPNEQPNLGEKETRDVESVNLQPASPIDFETPTESQPQDSVTLLNKDFKNEPARVHELTPKDLIPFMQIRLEGDTLFAVLKRVMQLTGIRIPDCAIQNIGTVKQLLAALKEKPKATKLAQVLTVNDQLKKLPNVQLMATRYTPISKEKENGRWKVIVKELKERDLPITGTLPPSEIEEMLQSEVSLLKRERLLRHLNG